MDRLLTNDHHRHHSIEHDHQQLHVDQQLDWSSFQSASGNHRYFGQPYTELYGGWTEYARRDGVHNDDYEMSDK